jgi:hypothetical protein
VGGAKADVSTPESLFCFGENVRVCLFHLSEAAQGGHTIHVPEQGQYHCLQPRNSVRDSPSHAITNFFPTFLLGLTAC